MTLASRPSDTFQPGDLLNNTYRIEGILGRGGTSEVYLAQSEISGRYVALKVLNAELSKNADNLLLMTREEEIRDVRHDAVIRYSENNRTPDNHVYLVMDYVKGPRLDEYMAEREVSVDELMTIAERVTDGLVAIHARKIVHRDLSPDNIILRDGKPSEAVIIDFGIARDTNVGAATIVGDGFAGKYAYAAPEQLSGQSDERTDLYSLGALLLAAYHGKSPSLGTNLLETVEAKKRPLDTEGVPEPLRSLIDRLTAPDPDDRPASATEVLALIRGDAPAATRAASGGQTLIGIGSERPAATAQQETSGGSSRRRLWALIVVGGLAAAGAGAWLSGLTDDLFAPSYPIQDPYTLDISKRPGNPPQLLGHAPSEDTRARLEAAVTDMGGVASLELASGTLPEDWGQGVIALIDKLADLDDWNLSLQAGRFEGEGIVTSTTERELMETVFAPGALPAGFSGQVFFAVGPRDLQVADVRQVLSEIGDCGRLILVDPPSASYALGQRIIVEGSVATRQTADALFTALGEAVGDRPVILDTSVLNPQLCLVEEQLSALVEVNAGVDTFVPGQAIEMSEGLSGASRPDGRFKEGENPVIDLILPPDLTEGNLWVTIVDINGVAFHLLPNLRSPDNDVPTIRASSGDRVRLSHPVGTEGKLVFNVDANSGKSKILIFHAAAPLFDQPRPTSESIEGFANALERRVGSGAVTIYSLTEEIIETE